MFGRGWLEKQVKAMAISYVRRRIERAAGGG
jgi:hypothetical protein